MDTDQQIELFTSSVEYIETSDVVDSLKPKRAIIKMRLINEGSNAKNLYWTPKTMEKVAHMFRGVPFRYDLTGQNEGSHTRDRLSSPFYDVGWTYGDERGAHYDAENHCIWVEGEVTNPEVIEKLQRQTSDGKREINYGSMGAMLKPEDTECSICGAAPFGSCKHERGQDYDGETCNMVPTNIAKALHVALTNDPADKVAEIAQAVFADMSTIADMPAAAASLPFAPNLPGPSGLHPEADAIRNMIREEFARHLGVKEDATMPEEKKKKKNPAYDDKEEKKDEKEAENPEPSESNTKPSLKKETQDAEEKKEKKDDEDEEEKKKKEKKKEFAEDPAKIEDKDSLNSKLKGSGAPTTETAEEESDEKDEKKKKKFGEKDEKKAETAESDDEEKEKDDDEDDEEEEKKKKKKIPPPAETADATEFKIRGPANHVQAPQQITAPVVETADNSNVYAEKYKRKLLMEVADSYVRFKKAPSRDAATGMLQGKSIEQLELFQEAFDGLVVPTAAPVLRLETQDTTHSTSKFAEDVPEFGGTSGGSGSNHVEVSDMSAEERRSHFGEFGAFDVCFNPQNASRYRKQ